MSEKVKSDVLSALTEQELVEFREIFNLVDRDGGGSISKKELGELLDTLGIAASQEEIDLMVAEIDADGNDEIDFEEFVVVMSRKISSQYTPDEVKRAFNVFRSPECPAGKIHVDRVLHALTKFGTSRLSREEALELTAQLDPDTEGFVSYERFVDMMCQ